MKSKNNQSLCFTHTSFLRQEAPRLHLLHVSKIFHRAETRKEVSITFYCWPSICCFFVKSKEVSITYTSRTYWLIPCVSCCFFVVDIEPIDWFHVFFFCMSPPRRHAIFEKFLKSTYFIRVFLLQYETVTFISPLSAALWYYVMCAGFFFLTGFFSGFAYGIHPRIFSRSGPFYAFLACTYFDFFTYNIYNKILYMKNSASHLSLVVSALDNWHS
jgi:hypothetical protein